MLKKLLFLVRMPFAGILFVLLIVAMAIATFVESGYGTNTAWALIYGTWWFELLFLLTGINLIGNILIFKLFRRSKLTVLTFHLAFILIILGAGITRYISQEGMMHIREGAVVGSIIGNDTYIDIEINSGNDVITDSKKTRLSILTPGKFRWSKKVYGKSVKIKSDRFMQNATRQYIAAPGGRPFAELVLVSDQQYNVGLTAGEELNYPGISVSLDSPESNSDVNLYSLSTGIIAIAKVPMQVSAMGTDEALIYQPGDTVIMEPGKLISAGKARMVLQRFMPSARLQYVEADQQQMNGSQVIRLAVNVDGMRSELYLPGRSNIEGQPSSVKMGDVEITCTYGSHRVQIPFALQLKDFQIDRYPGSNSPSSFASEVILIDAKQGLKEDHRIYMNNVLKHKGYRFYQSSYDTDEKGTILSVNKDSIGTTITYLGYFFLMLGMFLALFFGKTRFARLSRKSSGVKLKTVLIAILFMAGSSALFAQSNPATSRDMAKEFGQLWVQGKDGRFKPVNTLSNEIVRKITGKAHLQNLNSDQALLGMMLYPNEWNTSPIFEVENPEIQRMLGFKGVNVCFNDFIPEGHYLLSDAVNSAYSKRVPDRSTFDKEVIKLDEQVNVYYMVRTGGMLKIFPDIYAENDTWLSLSELVESDQPMSDTLAQVFYTYADALRTDDAQLATQINNYIRNYQLENCDILPKESKKKAEISYNKLKLFEKLVIFYALFGIILIILQFLRIFKPRRAVNYLFKVGVIHLAVALVLHTMALGLRWYIGGHAPMSNGYESRIFVSWLSLLAGLIFAKRSGFVIALAAILSALSLLVAHLSWMNPDITNLVPVLKSPWLTIHVAVIMAGYCLLGLSAMMGIINLVFYSVQNRKNSQKIGPVLDQITKVNHMAMIIGLYFLTAGVFLGGVWANESWGRYWGWDPKETWALISVLVYAFIVHMHQFPGFKGGYAFNLASLLGFSSILMTYFGVNYFLGGMHSYAGGTTLSIPWYTVVIIASIIALCVLAYWRQVSFKDDYLEEVLEA